MRLCKRALNRVQIIDENGTVRLCGWGKDHFVIGSLCDNSLDELYHNEIAQHIREMHAKEDYSECDPNACQWVANNTVDEIMVEIDEVPRWPEELQIGFERQCNYQCTSCTTPNYMRCNANNPQLQEKYDRIESEIRKILPHIKHIGAHGTGELFASPRTLRLLGEWEPLAPKEEIEVDLETNGSLYTPENWAKIANLGQYNLKVSITIMSFEETAYQYLSGTKLPISVIEENLRFVKSLREQGVINYLTLATVYQERNFRHLPEFTRRCLEEFGADHVRLRAFEPWVEPGINEWVMDVRNEYHPYHQEFLEVMKHPIFNDPRVVDQGGGQPSGLGPAPYSFERKKSCLYEQMLNTEFWKKVTEKVQNDSVVIYALGPTGKALVNYLKDKMEVPYIIDRKKMEKCIAVFPYMD